MLFWAVTFDDHCVIKYVWAWCSSMLSVLVRRENKCFDFWGDCLGVNLFKTVLVATSAQTNIRPPSAKTEAHSQHWWIDCAMWHVMQSFHCEPLVGGDRSCVQAQQEGRLGNKFSTSCVWLSKGGATLQVTHSAEMLIWAGFCVYFCGVCEIHVAWWLYVSLPRVNSGAL